MLGVLTEADSRVLGVVEAGMLGVLEGRMCSLARAGFLFYRWGDRVFQSIYKSNNAVVVDNVKRHALYNNKQMYLRLPRLHLGSGKYR